MLLQWSGTVGAFGVILLLAFHLQEGEGSQEHFVLIHGLGHGAWCWYKIVTLLKQMGHRVAALDLTSNGINRAAPTNEVNSIAHYAKPLLDYISNLGNDEKVTLVGHSLGGCPLSYAMEMYPTKISKAIFVSAFTPRNNQSFLSSSNPKSFARLVENGVIVLNREADSELPTSASLALDHVQSYLYNKSPDEDANLAQSLLTPTPFSSVSGVSEVIRGEVWEYQKILHHVNEGQIVPSRVPGVHHRTESSRESIQITCQRPFTLFLTASAALQSPHSYFNSLKMQLH